MAKVKRSGMKQNQGVYSTPMGSYSVVRDCDKLWDPEIVGLVSAVKYELIRSNNFYLSRNKDANEMSLKLHYSYNYSKLLI